MDAIHGKSRVLLALAIGLVPAFGLTGAASWAWHRRCERLSLEWSDRGRRAPARHQISEALLDFRNAVVYLPANRGNRLDLADTLA